jgi:hypothetical protein
MLWKQKEAAPNDARGTAAATAETLALRVAVRILKWVQPLRTTLTPSIRDMTWRGAACQQLMLPPAAVAAAVAAFDVGALETGTAQSLGSEYTMAEHPSPQLGKLLHGSLEMS